MQYNIIESGKRVKMLRETRHLTQSFVASQLNIRYETLSGIENGRRAASMDLLIDIAEFYGVSLDYLILGKEDPILRQLYCESRIVMEHMAQIQKLINECTSHNLNIT